MNKRKKSIVFCIMFFFISPIMFMHQGSAIEIQSDLNSSNQSVINNNSIYDIGLNDLIEKGYTGKNVTIAILDTGILYTDNRLYRNGEPIVKKSASFVSNEPNYDLNGHGTAIAGLISASYMDSSNPNLKGISPNVNLWNIKVMDSDGTGNIINIIKGIKYCYYHKNDIDIISMSLGTFQTDEKIFNELSYWIKKCWDAGIVIVAAAGNEGDRANPYFTIDSPSSELEVISVGASIDGEYLASFSSVGPSPITNHAKPEIIAPGYNITSIGMSGGIISESGTSFSTPIVASGIALLLEEMNKSVTPDEIKYALMSTATDMGYNFYQQGCGLVNFSSASDLLMNKKNNMSAIILPNSLLFPNVFDPEKSKLNIKKDNDGFAINYIKSTLILIHDYNLTINIDPDISDFIEIHDIENNTLYRRGQYVVGIDFVENFVFGKAFPIFPKEINGKIYFVGNNTIISSVSISIYINIVAILQNHISIILFSILSFISILTIYKKKSANKKIKKIVICKYDGSDCKLINANERNDQ